MDQEFQSEASDTDGPGFENEESELIRQERASAKALARARAEQEWEEIWKRGTAPRIMVAGLGGVGKSTLVNHLFGLGKEESVAKEGCSGKATTLAVRRYRHQLKNGVEATIFDTPGFDDAEINEHRILADMQLTAEEELDLLLYCVSLASPGTRVTQGDVRALRLLTNVFGSSLWKNAIFVVTFANVACMWAKKDQYDQLKRTIDEELRKHLKDKASVPADIVAEIPLATAGHTESMIKHEEEDWVGRLFELLLKRNSQTATALLKGGMSTKEQFLAFLTELIVEHGVYLMSLAGAATGSRIRPVNAPFGQPLGATVGSMMGMGIFALISASSATVELKRTLKLYKDKKEVMRQGKYLIAEKKKQARAGTS